MEHYFAPASAEALERARAVRLLVLDVDGVLTDGTVYMGHEGELLKAFHIQDGKGISMLRECGIQTAILTARRSPAIERRAEELRIEHVLQGRQPKWPALEELLGELGLDAREVAYAGDDLVDVPVLRRVGLAAAVANAHPLVRGHSHWQSERPGGCGAVRELCELILSAQNRLDAILERYATE